MCHWTRGKIPPEEIPQLTHLEKKSPQEKISPPLEKIPPGTILNSNDHLS
jgi:hypothetical protein